MLISLIILLLRRHHKTFRENLRPPVLKVLKALRLVALLLFCVAIKLTALSQERNLSYQVMKNGNVIGIINLQQIMISNRSTIRVVSEVKTRFLFSFKIKSHDEAIYEDGRLISSTTARQMNGGEPTIKKTKLNGSVYEVQRGDKKEVFNHYPINQNSLTLYIQEPVNVKLIYLDFFQQFVNIIPISPHHYKIVLPDGNTNEYYYQNGLCTKIKLLHTFFTAQIELR
jgi:hypothetical protein